MKTPTPKDIGALIRDARLAAGLSQTELGDRIGASRFWVAEFERGKPRAELGLALKAIRALRLVLSIEPKDVATKRERAGQPERHATWPPAVDLASVIAHATLTSAAQRRLTAGWPTAAATARKPSDDPPREPRHRNPAR